MHWYDLFGNFAFILVAFSLLAKDILWLRSLSVASSLCAIVFNMNASSIPLWTPIRWNLFFIGLNLFHISKIVFSKKNIQLSEKDLVIYQWFFKELSHLEFHKLIGASRAVHFQAGEVITLEGEEVSDLRLIYSGRVDVLKNGIKVAELKDGQFVGEMSFLSNQPATATVKAHYPTEVISWNQKELKNLLLKNPSMIFSLQGALGAQLSKVMESKNEADSKIQKKF